MSLAVSVENEIRAAFHKGIAFARLHSTTFVIVLIINFLAHGYLFVEYIFNNHTLPLILMQPWPGHRIWEGRWIAEFIYHLQGGSGIPLLHQSLATVLQICNGIYFATLLRPTSRAQIVIGATIISIHPYILDYYSYVGDHLVFVLGDSFILLAFGLAIRNRHWFSLLAAACLVSFALATYQPKISILAVIVAIFTLTWFAQPRDRQPTLRELIVPPLALALTFIAGIVLYYVQFKALFYFWPNASTALRLYTNNFDDIIKIIPEIYRNFGQHIFLESYIFPTWVQWIQAAIIGIFFCFYAWAVWKNFHDTKIKLYIYLISIFMMVTVPLYIYASFIVSKNSYWLFFRFYVAYSYLLAFLLIHLVKLAPGLLLRRASCLLSALVIARFVVLDARILHYSYLDRVQELAIVTRALDRLERDPRFASASPHALVVFGLTPRSWPRDLSPGMPVANNQIPAFHFFRQPELLNFYAGQQAFRYPTAAEITVARAYAETHAAWPAADSVTFLEGGIAVIVFEVPQSWTSTTMTQ